MKSLFLTVFFSALCTGVFAQKADSTKSRATQAGTSDVQHNNYDTYQSTNQIVGSTPYTMILTRDQRYEGLRGSPYFLPEWNKGQIEVISGKHYKDVPIKFDASRQHLILRRTGVTNDSIIVDANQVKSFQFTASDGQFYVFRRFPDAKTDDAALREGYFLVLHQGKTALLKRIAKTLKKADYKNPYSNDIRYDEFLPVTTYFLLKPDQTLSKVKLSDKSLIEALGDHKEELKAYAKQENLTVKDENGAIQLITKYNSL
ncbi:hypothetical protein [Spirosoma sp.]|uniref:hypothetical protein n=1 Tax=Spirosoma sp. TaxID=1899569 RepID=UPI003B3B21F4